MDTFGFRPVDVEELGESIAWLFAWDGDAVEGFVNSSEDDETIGAEGD